MVQNNNILHTKVLMREIKIGLSIKRHDISFYLQGGNKSNRPFLSVRKWAPAEVDQLIIEYAFPIRYSTGCVLSIGQIQLIIHHGDLASNERENV